MNAAIGFKRFLTNKNTVTLIGVLISIFVLYYAYEWRVNQAIQPYSIPYALNSIQPRTQITEDMVGTLSVPKNMIKSTVLTSSSSIIGKYVNINAMIPQGSLFYETAVVELNELPNAFVYDVPEGYTSYNLNLLDSVSGYGILPDTYIDIYVKVTVDSGEPMVGKLVENVKVSVVLDKNLNPVYDNLDEDRLPNTFIFAVPNDIHLLLIKASYLSTYKVEIFPVVAYTYFEDGTDVTKLTSTDLKEFIEENTINVNLDTYDYSIPDNYPSLGN